MNKLLSEISLLIVYFSMFLFTFRWKRQNKRDGWHKESTWSLSSDTAAQSVALTSSDPASIGMDLYKTSVTKNKFFPLCIYVEEESESVRFFFFAQPKKGVFKIHCMMVNLLHWWEFLTGSDLQLVYVVWTFINVELLKQTSWLDSGSRTSWLG